MLRTVNQFAIHSTVFRSKYFTEDERRGECGGDGEDVFLISLQTLNVKCTSRKNQMCFSNPSQVFKYAMGWGGVGGDYNRCISSCL